MKHTILVTRTRENLIRHLADVGELIRRGEDLYEDMGGHLLHESHLDPYITEYLERLSPEERAEVIKLTGEHREN